MLQHMAPPKKKKFSRLQRFRKWLNIILWSGFLIVLLMVGGIFYAIAKGYIGYMPPIDQLENPIDRYASQLLSADGVWLGSYFKGKDNRINIKYSELSPFLVHALIATEDIRFTQHSGIDVKGLARAVIKRGFMMQKSGGGGSTITQQLAKQLFSPEAGNITERVLQKPIEWVIAVRLEKYFTKEEIINLYLNKFDFLYNAVGIQSAAHTYFNTSPKNLKIEEAATLIGMCKNPSYYNPKKYTERAQGRRNTVLIQMCKYGYLEQPICDSLIQLPLTLQYSSVDHKLNKAPYLWEYLRLTLTATKPDRKDYRQSWRQQQFLEDSVAWETNPAYGWCNKNFKPNGERYDIYTDGLKIHTTLDSRMQQYAEEAVKEHIRKELQPNFNREKRGKKYAPYTFPPTMSEKEREAEFKRKMNNAISQTDRYRAMQKAEASADEITKVFNTKTEMSIYTLNGYIDTIMTPYDSVRHIKSFLRAAFMAMEARTGHVKAYVGGTDFATFQYDMVTKGRRQIGSTMKPFVYSLAMSEGFTPCNTMLHVEQTLLDENNVPWTPHNASASRVGETVTIQWGLQHSSNWVTAYLMSNLSPYALERLLRSYGFQGPIDPVVAMCLGTPDISVAEMVSAYSVFTNKGLRIEPMYITHIEDPYGNTVASFKPQTNEVLQEDATYKMLNMLESVVEGGTANRIRMVHGIKAAMGGKTGTTQEHSDAWYMGFIPSLIAGCWVGGDERTIHFESMSTGQGAHVALPIYANFMKKVFADPQLDYSENEIFEIPDEYLDPCRTKNRRGETDNSDKKKSGADSFFF